MPKFAWALIIGGAVTYLAHRYNKTLAIVAGVATVVVAFLLWKKG